jgi:tetratricopeptide (TPR) repeat protein
MNTQQLSQLKKLAEDQYNIGDFEKSMVLYQQALKVDPTDVDSIQKIANMLRSSHQLVKLNNHYIMCAKNLFNINNKLAIELLDIAENLFPGSSANHRKDLSKIESELIDSLKPMKQVDNIKFIEITNPEIKEIDMPKLSIKMRTEIQIQVKKSANVIIENSKEMESKSRLEIRQAMIEIMNIINNFAIKVDDLENYLRNATNEIRTHNNTISDLERVNRQHESENYNRNNEIRRLESEISNLKFRISSRLPL